MGKKVYVDVEALRSVLQHGTNAFDAYLKLCAAVDRADNRPVRSYVRFGEALAGIEAFGEPYSAAEWRVINVTPTRRAKFKKIALRHESTLQIEEVLPKP